MPNRQADQVAVVLTVAAAAAVMAIATVDQTPAVAADSKNVIKIFP